MFIRFNLLLIIIVCAVEKSLHEKSADDEVQNGPSIVVDEALGRRRGTLSELLSAASSAYVTRAQEASGGPSGPAPPGDRPEDGESGTPDRVSPRV